MEYMWLSLPEDASSSWFSIEAITYLHPYRSIQKQIAQAFAPYATIAGSYSEATRRVVKPLTTKYLDKSPEVSEQNVALLKNAIELWKTATKTSDAIAPILAHYSWHCFNSFFVYSLLRWEPQHSKSHGILVKLDDELSEIRVQILKSGLFQRLIDTWTVIGASLAFSRFLPVVKGQKVEFIPNEEYLPGESDELSPEQLLRFKPVEYEKSLHEIQKGTLLSCPFIANSISLPNEFFRSYLLLFLASSIARYRPVLWKTVLSGEGRLESDLAIDSSEALLHYTLGRHRGLGLVDQVTRILRAIEKGHFVLKKSADGTPVERDAK